MPTDLRGTTHLPMPDHAAVAPSDWLGSGAVEVMLQDLRFPRSAADLKARTGAWLVPVKASHETVRLGDLLAPLDDDRTFRSAHEVADEIRRLFHGF